MNKIYHCYKMARRAAEEFGEKFLQNKDDQTMSVDGNEKTVVQSWREPGFPVQRTMEFKWDGDCCGH